jgi:hypothetical protein
MKKKIRRKQSKRERNGRNWRNKQKIWGKNEEDIMIIVVLLIASTCSGPKTKCQ